MEHHATNSSSNSASPLYSTVADDVIYIAQKCAERAVATGHADVVCAVLNNMAGTLRRWHLARLAERLNSGSGWSPTTLRKSAMTSPLCALNSLAVTSRNIQALERTLVSNLASFSEGSSSRRKVGCRAPCYLLIRDDFHSCSICTGRSCH